MKTLKEEIAKKGGTLRTLYLIQRLFEEMDEEVVSDGLLIKKVFSDIIEKIDRVIPLVEGELPEWAKKRARETFDLRRGFIIWEPPEELEEVMKGGM